MSTDLVQIPAPPGGRPVPMFGSPCGVCGQPGIVMFIGAGWSVVYHHGPAITGLDHCTVGDTPCDNWWRKAVTR